MKKNLTDYKFKNLKVIVRCDLNVPIKDGVITDDTRIKKSLETLEFLIYGGAKVIVLSHLGRIKEESDKVNNTLLPVSKRMSELLRRDVKFIPYTRGVEVENAVNMMNPGDIIMLENTRFEDLDGKKESNNDLELAKYWASLGDLFVNDAFGTLHRAHASNVGIASFIPSALGFLVKEEVDKINAVINNPNKPFTVLLGGAKVSDKIGVIENALQKADYVLIAGGMHFTFYKAMGINIGSSIVDDNSLDFCKKMLTLYPDKIILPTDILVASSLTEAASTKLVSKDSIGQNDIGIDIGIETLNKFRTILMNSETIVWNGPVGMFEIAKFSLGTRKIVEMLSNSRAKILIGGGDTIAAINKYNFVNKNAHISTGGGASLAMLEGKTLPGFQVISEK